MSRLLVTAVASIALAVAGLAAHPAQFSAQATTVTTNKRVPIGPPRNTQPNPCVSPTDIVTLNGYLHIVIYQTVNANGQVTSDVEKVSIECR